MTFWVPYFEKHRLKKLLWPLFVNYWKMFGHFLLRHLVTLSIWREQLKPYLLVDPILVDGPDRRNVGVEKLGQRGLLPASSCTDETGFANGIVANLL